MKNRAQIITCEHRLSKRSALNRLIADTMKVVVLSIFSTCTMLPKLDYAAFAFEKPANQSLTKNDLRLRKMNSIDYSLDEPHRIRSDFLAPFGSFLLPGLDQWIEGQTEQAAIYTGGFLFSTYLETLYHATMSKERVLKEVATTTPTDPFVKNRTMRRRDLASQSARTFGALSAYQSFRGAAMTRQARGEYLFLENYEPISKIALAPFEFTYLKNSSSYIPIGIAAILAGLNWSQSPEQLEKLNLKRSFSFDDGAFASATSYNAGVWEEAVFRGWLLPYAYQQFGSQTLANLSIAGIFAIAHRSSENPIPFPQFAVGAYLGSLTMDSGWSISESIFIHTWWDVLIIASQYSLERNSSDTKPILRLPPISLHF